MKVKLLKIIISFLLILSMVFPLYASSGDSSSFVTKAEFDSALSNFNERLTAFEAGINSKIDTQVTTYLDRNGIWSKKAQTLIQPWFYYDLLKGIFSCSSCCFYGDTPFTGSTASISYTYGNNSSSTPVSLSKTIYLSSAVLNNTTQQNIAHIDKSGLIYMDFNVAFASQFGDKTPSSSASFGNHVIARWLRNVSSKTDVDTSTGWLTQSWYDTNKTIARSHPLLYYQNNYMNDYDQLFVKSNYSGVGNSGVKYEYGVEIQLNGIMITRKLVDQNYVYQPTLNGYGPYDSFSIPFAQIGETGVLRYTCNFFVKKGDTLSMGPYALALGRHNGGIVICNIANKGYFIMGADFNALDVY